MLTSLSDCCIKVYVCKTTNAFTSVFYYMCCILSKPHISIPHPFCKSVMGKEGTRGKLVQSSKGLQHMSYNIAPGPYFLGQLFLKNLTIKIPQTNELLRGQIACQRMLEDPWVNSYFIY